MCVCVLMRAPGYAHLHALVGGPGKCDCTALMLSGRHVLLETRGDHNSSVQALQLGHYICDSIVSYRSGEVSITSPPI